MIKEPNMLVEQPHSLGAMMKGAILLIFFVFGVATYAQSYNAPISYRISGTTQSTASAEQWNGGVANGQATSGVYGAADGGYQPAGKAGGYNVNNGFGWTRSDFRSVVETDVQQNAYKAYQAAVYEPFNDTPPSESGNAPRGISGRKNLGGMDGHDPGGPGSSNSPVGEPFVLLLFAAVAAAVVAWRQKRRAQV